jgi:hypothetical protein
MKKTIRDIEKAGGESVKWFKTGVYYLYLPTVLFLGLRSVNWAALFNQAQPLN